MEFSEALRVVVEKHVEKHGMASLWGTPGVYEALAEDPAWANEAIALVESEEDDQDEEEDEEGDECCDLCMTSGVNADRTTYCGKVIGQECGCDDGRPEGTCGNPACEPCAALSRTAHRAGEALERYARFHAEETPKD